jgi:cytochrome c oxidase subunit 2
MIKANFNENLTTDVILKNTTILDPITFESILLKGGYDYEDCCCSGTCSCGCGHNKIELSEKMTTLELDEMSSNILINVPILEMQPEILYVGNGGSNVGGANQSDQPNLPNPGSANNPDKGPNKYEPIDDVVLTPAQLRYLDLVAGPEEGDEVVMPGLDEELQKKIKEAKAEYLAEMEKAWIERHGSPRQILPRQSTRRTYYNGNNNNNHRNNNIVDDLNIDNTLAYDFNNVIIENLILEQPDINIPLIALRIGVIFLICMFIEVCNAWEALGIKRKPSGKKDNSISGSKLLDAPVSWGLYFQDAASPSFEGIVDLHNRIMFYLVVILFGVSWVMLSVITNFNNSSNKLVYRHLNHGTLIELIWTVGPALVLVAIAFPSFKLLYLMDEVIDPAMTVKVTGHQWFWEYEYADFLNEENEAINFDSYMKDESILEKGQLRMLEVDNPLLLPIDTHIRFVITAADVLHDWALPSLSLKVDACPGRLNQASVIIERPGYLYGQCSEICGVLHSSMPINIEAVEVEKFFLWLLVQ